MGKPHLFWISLLCKGRRFIKRHMLVFLALAAFSFSPYIPSQIKRSAPAAYSAITGTGLVSVQYVTLSPLRSGPSTISGVKSRPSCSISSPFAACSRTFWGISLDLALSTSKRPVRGW